MTDKYDFENIQQKNIGCFHLSFKMWSASTYDARGLKDHYAKIIDIFQASIKQKFQTLQKIRSQLQK